MMLVLCIICAALFLYIRIVEVEQKEKTKGLVNYIHDVEKRIQIAKDVINTVREDNPYDPKTPVTVFTQGTEADQWMSENCDKCTLKNTCLMYYNMTHSSHDFYCEIPLESAQKIGMDYEALYRQGHLYWRCLKFKKEGEPEDELNF